MESFYVFPGVLMFRDSPLWFAVDDFGDAVCINDLVHQLSHSLS